MIFTIIMVVAMLGSVFFLGRWSILHAQHIIKMEIDLIEPKRGQAADEAEKLAFYTMKEQRDNHRARNIRRYVPPDPSGIPNPQFRAAWAQAELDRVKKDYLIEEDDDDSGAK